LRLPGVTVYTGAGDRIAASAAAPERAVDAADAADVTCWRPSPRGRGRAHRERRREQEAERKGER
jgi:hypothetical protein